MPRPDPAAPPTPVTVQEGAAVFAALRAGEAVLLRRDEEGALVVSRLPPGRLTSVGREGDLRIADPRVSRLHAEFTPMGSGWAVGDERLSRNGTFLNGRRVSSRERLADGDVVRVGDTVLCFRQSAADTEETEVGSSRGEVAVTETQLAVLQALCRPVDLLRGTLPASNEEIAAELVVTVDAVKAQLRLLYARFGLADLPPHAKRSQLAREAIVRGLAPGVS